VIDFAFARCRKQPGKLVRLSWLSPRAVEAFVRGYAPSHITRKLLLDRDFSPLARGAQEDMLGIAR